MKERKTIFVFDGVVFDKNGRILIDRRTGDELEEVNGLWEVPGGKLEFGETPEQAIEREILEETGYRVKVGNQVLCTQVEVLEYPDKLQHTVVFYYVCELLDEERTEVHDHKISDCRWVGPEELDGYEFLLDNRAVIDLALQRRGRA